MNGKIPKENLPAEIEKDITDLIFRGISTVRKYMSAKKQSQPPSFICVKCGGNDISTQWCELCDDFDRPIKLRHKGEVLHHHCRRCEYEWNQDVMEASKK